VIVQFAASVDSADSVVSVDSRRQFPFATSFSWWLREIRQVQPASAGLTVRLQQSDKSTAGSPAEAGLRETSKLPTG